MARKRLVWNTTKNAYETVGDSNVMEAEGSDSPALILRAKPGQTGNLLEIRDDEDNVLSSVDNSGISSGGGGSKWYSGYGPAGDSPNQLDFEIDGGGWTATFTVTLPVGANLTPFRDSDDNLKISAFQNGILDQGGHVWVDNDPTYGMLYQYNGADSESGNSSATVIANIISHIESVIPGSDATLAASTGSGYAFDFSFDVIPSGQGEFGVDGDFYLDTTNGDYYTKDSGSWMLVGNLSGGGGGDFMADGSVPMTGNLIMSPSTNLIMSPSSNLITPFVVSPDDDGAGNSLSLLITSSPPVAGDGNVGNVQIQTADGVGTSGNDVGYIQIRTGQTTDVSQNAGLGVQITTAACSGTDTAGILIGTGGATNEISGAVLIQTGGAGGDSSGQIQLATGNCPDGTGQVELVTGNAGAGPSGSGPVVIHTGDVSAGTANSGNVTIGTGSSFGGTRGAVTIDASAIVLEGPVPIKSSDIDPWPITISSGDVPAGSADVTIKSGSSIAGASGNVHIGSGSGASGRGYTEITGGQVIIGSAGGSIELVTQSSSGDSPLLGLETGSVTGEDNSGFVAITTGSVEDGAAGDIILSPGNVTGAGSSGTIQMNGTVSMNSLKITNLADPTVAQDAATKAYADGLVASGAGTAATSSVTNWTSLAATAEIQWMRVKNVVTVSGHFNGGATGTGNAVFDLDLPIASTLSASHKLAGNFTCPTQAGFNGSVYANTSTNKAKFQWNATGINFVDFYFTFTYQVV